MARAGNLPAECCFSIFILHLLRDRQGGLLTPLPHFGGWWDLGEVFPSPSTAHASRFPSKAPFCIIARSPLIWWVRVATLGALDRDPWNLIQVNDIPIPPIVPSGLPCLNMQNGLRPAKWPVTQMSACVCIFISLILGVCNICLFKRPVPSGWDSCPQIGPNVLGSDNFFFIMCEKLVCVFWK